MQDGETPHTAKETIGAIAACLGNLVERIELLSRVCGLLDLQN
jgi:hypothetical protein